MPLILLLLLSLTFVHAVEPGMAPSTEPWCMVPGWLAEIPVGLPPLVICDEPYEAEPGEFSDPLLEGDQILNFGDPREALLIVARQPLEQDGVEVTVERAGIKQKVVVDRLHFERHLRAARWTADGAKRFVAMGIGGDPASLNRIPGRVVSHLVAGGKAPWVARVVATWLAVEAGGEPPVMGEPASDPFIASCEAMWRKAAAGDPLPDAWGWGVEPEFAALYMPYSGGPAPALGALGMHDQGFVAAMQQAASQSPTVSLAARRTQAYRNVSEGEAGAEAYIGQVKAAILDTDNHGGWPFRSSQIWEPPARTAVLKELRARRAAGGGDRPLIDLALIGPLVMENEGAELESVLTELRKDSPALARRGFNFASGAAEMHAQGQPAFIRIQAMDKAQPFIIRPPRMAFYNFLFERASWLFDYSAFADYDQVHGHPATLREQPAEVARVLSRWWDLPRQLTEQRQSLAQHLNHVAWWAGVKPLAFDKSASQELADQLRHLDGRGLPAYILDTVAANCAASGDFLGAVRSQSLALMNDSTHKARFLSRLQQYQLQEVYREKDETAPAALINDDENWPNGKVKMTGKRIAATHQRVGWWRSFAEDGTKIEEQLWHDDQPFGIVRRFHPNGQLREIGVYENGVKVGRWRTCAPDGQQLTETWWMGQPIDEQTWWSSAWHANGSVRETGAYNDGKKEGFWRTWRADHSPVGAGNFALGEAIGVWRTWTAEGVATDRTMDPHADNSF